MATRTTPFGGGRPGSVIEYRGDLTPPTQSYASVYANTTHGQALAIPATTIRTRSSVVTAKKRRGRLAIFYGYGARRNPQALPFQGNQAVGGVNRSAFQPFMTALFDWHNYLSWHEAGYPRNLGYSFRVPQLETNVTGAPGKSRSTTRPIYSKVQTVGRATATVTTLPTTGAGR